MKKKYRIKKKPVIILMLSTIIVVVLLCFAFSSKYKIIIDNIEVNDSNIINYKITYKNEDISNKCKLESVIDNKIIGKQKVIFLCDKVKVKGNVNVIDNKAPVLSLNGGDMVKIAQNSAYEEYGYTVIDNYDQKISVKITGKVDTKVIGTYELKYSSVDSSNNKAEKIRKVIVTDKSPLNMSLKNFTLDGYFENVKPKESEEQDSDYIKQFIYVGDSVPLYYVITEHIGGNRLWHKEGLSLAQVFTQEIYIAHQKSGLTLVQAFEKYKPKAVIINLGMNSVSSMTSKYFIGEYAKLIKKIKEVSPNTVIAINSIPPVAKSYDDNKYNLNNEKINEFNYYILEMCAKLNIYYLDSASVLKDSNGQCKEGYYLDKEEPTRAHQTVAGNNAVFEYFKTHKIKLEG